MGSRICFAAYCVSDLIWRLGWGKQLAWLFTFLDPTRDGMIVLVSWKLLIEVFCRTHCHRQGSWLTMSIATIYLVWPSPYLGNGWLIWVAQDAAGEELYVLMRG